ncbi:UDP-N-acetylmuramoyl-L-alanine--D-glutamate ligase [Pelagibacterium halotolerans]|uniref:UDP-N-acetylmuramoyl-L-alanine--D-glutamate ligase n=1 Tax=Pelagibacterium halotolerans TaxID=531813 RepID=UPI003850F578
MRINGPVLIYGAGREARSTAAFLKKRYPALDLFVTTDDGVAELPGATFISPREARDVTRFGLIVKSPGVSLYKPFFDTVRAAGIPITSNLNLWATHFREDRTVVAITGTKGKSTTATLVHLMLIHSGVDAILAGNVGIPPLDAADKAKVIVFELSSYQTADIAFAPDIAALTNLYPEHVDWHGSVERYYADKLNLFARSPAKIALGKQAAAAAPVSTAIAKGSEPVSPLSADFETEIENAAATSRLKGAHNHENARLAAMIALAAGATRRGILAGIAAFKPLPHRLEELTLGNLVFIDDSISTTPEATKAALAAYKGKRIALIAGGHERQQDYTELAGLLADAGVVMLCCLPVTGTRLAKAVRAAAPHIPVAECRSLESAVQMLAGTGTLFDAVILSPGAPSYNQFTNFEERGEAFKMLARAYFPGGERP